MFVHFKNLVILKEAIISVSETKDSEGTLRTTVFTNYGQNVITGNTLDEVKEILK